MPAHVNPKQRAFILALTILGCLLILFFGLRTVHAFRKFNGHFPPPRPHGEVETDVERIREWMTIPFIARMYDVPEDILFDALGVPPEGNHKKNLEDLQRKYFPQADVFFVKETIKAAIVAHQTTPMPDSPIQPEPPPTLDSPAP